MKNPKIPVATTEIVECARAAKEALYQATLCLMIQPEHMPLYETGVRAQHTMQILAVFQPEWCVRLARQSAMSQLGDEAEHAYMSELYSEVLEQSERLAQALADRVSSRDQPRRKLLVDLDTYGLRLVALMGSGHFTVPGALFANKALIATMMFSSTTTNSWVSSWQDRQMLGSSFQADIVKARESVQASLREMREHYEKLVTA